MATRDKLNWGIFGASTIAAEFLIPAIRANGHHIEALLSSNAQHAQAYAKKHAIEHFATSLDTILDEHKLDAVYISSTNDKHLSQGRAAAKRGIHVLCEKPLTTTLKDADELVQTCRKEKVLLAVDHHLRCAESHILMRKLLQQEKIGIPIALRAYHTFLIRKHLQTWRLNDPAAGAGSILDVLVHQADVMRFMLKEEPVDILCEQQFFGLGNKNKNIEDGSMSIMRFASGVIAHTHETYTTPHTQTALHILGSKGTIEGIDVMRQQGGGEVLIADNKGRRKISFPKNNCYEQTIARFVKSIMRGDPLPADGVDGLKSLAVAIAAKRAASTGKKQKIDYLNY